MRERLAEWARLARRDVLALYLAARDPRVPRAAKVLATVAAAYALSPIDLIPDFIPVLGYLDDLVVLPVMVLLVVRLIPKNMMAELRAEANTRLSGRAPRSMASAVVIVVVWIALLAAVVLMLLKAEAGGC